MKKVKDIVTLVKDPKKQKEIRQRHRKLRRYGHSPATPEEIRASLMYQTAIEEPKKPKFNVVKKEEPKKKKFNVVKKEEPKKKKFNVVKKEEEPKKKKFNVVKKARKVRSDKGGTHGKDKRVDLYSVSTATGAILKRGKDLLSNKGKRVTLEEAQKISKKIKEEKEPKEVLQIREMEKLIDKLRPLTKPIKTGTIYQKEYDKLAGKTRKDFTELASKLNADFVKKYGYSPGISLFKSMTPERQRRYIAQKTAQETSGLNRLIEDKRKLEEKIERKK